MPAWLPHYEQEHGELDSELRGRVLAISAAQIDRLLAPRKARACHRGRSGTKPGGLLKTQIPIRTNNWDITKPGFLEADTVAHCGGSSEGDFIWSVTYCDIYSGCLGAEDDVAFPLSGQGRHTGMWISELDGWPASPRTHATHGTSPLPA